MEGELGSARLGHGRYLLESHAASVVCELSCVYKVELQAEAMTEYMRGIGRAK